MLACDMLVSGIAMAKASRKVKPEAKESQPSGFRWFLGHVFSLVRRHGNFFVGCALAGFCVYQLAEVLKAYAGKQSGVQLNFWLSLMANAKVEFVVTITVSGLSIGLYL